MFKLITAMTSVVVCKTGYAAKDSAADAVFSKEG
jgi:hypothetical protein